MSHKPSTCLQPTAHPHRHPFTHLLPPHLSLHPASSPPSSFTLSTAIFLSVHPPGHLYSAFASPCSKQPSAGSQPTHDASPWACPSRGGSYLVSKLHVQLLSVLLTLLSSFLLGSDGPLQGLFVSFSLLLQFLQLLHDGLHFRLVLVSAALQVLGEDGPGAGAGRGTRMRERRRRETRKAGKGQGREQR